MRRELDLSDIQGNVVRAYAVYNYPHSRYMCFHISEPQAGRAFVDAVRREVTTAQRWLRGKEDRGPDSIERPPVAVNIAISFRGLLFLELSTRSLREMPPEFIDGMGRRADILGDTGRSGIGSWDEVWRHPFEREEMPETLDKDDVHILVLLNAKSDGQGRPVPELDRKTDWLRGLCDRGIRVLAGHGPERLDHQDGNALFTEIGGKMVPTGTEHFGYADGFGNPVFEGQFEPGEEQRRVIGRGKLMPDQSWAPLATGEFLLGYPDEAQEIAGAAPPAHFSRNGSFMVFRKLHQNVRSFRDFVEDQAARFAKVTGADIEEAEATLSAKMVGRWKDGVPLLKAPDFAAWQAFRERWKGRERTTEYDNEIMDFKFAGDRDGIACPVAAHLRRANTRDMLDPTIDVKGKQSGSALNRRRRILRRGLPYGAFPPDAADDSGEHGIIFIGICASIFRQFEFVQQQWMNYGLDFNVGNDTCPMIGNREAGAKFVIPSDPNSGKPPFICADLPQFVETRGGEYFFVPSMTALGMIAMGSVDPT